MTRTFDRLEPGRFVSMARTLALAAVLAVTAVATPSLPALAQDEVEEEGFRPRPVREGTVTLGGQAMYGSLFGSSRFSEVFDRGLGLGFSLRYRTSRESAIGLGFEAHHFQAKDEPDSLTAPDRLQFIVTTLDYYRYFRTRSRTPRYVVVGAGLVQTRQVDADEVRQFPGDGGAVKLGGGVEYWARRTLTFDFGLRYYGVLSRSEWTHDVQAAVGVNFYTSP